MKRLPWIIQLASKCNHMYPYKRKTEKGFIIDRRGEGKTTMEADLEG